jgi:putative peptidoglycan lipid II flippase
MRIYSRKEAITIDTTEKIKKSALVTVLVMGCTLISRLLGFLRIALIGALFGASGTADVWNAVFTIPNNLRKLLAEGALSSAFIPAFSSTLLEPEGRQKAKTLTRSIITLQLLILIPLVLLALIFTRPIISALLSFPSAEKMAMSARLFRWVFCYLLFISISAVLVAILNSHNIFIVPALTPLVFSVCMIGSTLLFYRSLGIFSMAVGILLGGLTQILFQTPTYLRLGYDFRPCLRFGDERFRKILRSWVPVLVSSSIFAINQQVAVLFASGLEDGSTSALSNALVFWQLPFGIFSTSVVTVLFPRLSRQAALEDREGLIETLSYGLRYILILLVPAALVYIFMAPEIIALALQRLSFTSSGTVMAARVLRAYSYGLFSLGAFTFLQRFFYAVQDFRTPLITAALVCTVDIILSLILKETPLRVAGLAVANSVAFTLGLLMLLAGARRKLGRLNGRKLLATGWRACLAFAPMSLFLYLFLHLTRGAWTPGSSLGNLGLLLAALLGSGALLFGIYYVTGIEIIRDIIRGRIAKR